MARWRSFPEPKTVLSLAVWGEGWLVGAATGLWRADADGVELIAEPLRAVTITAVAVGGARLFVGASDGVAFSDDGGQSWTAGALARPAQVTQIVLSPAFERDGIGFAATTNCGVLRTTDGGITWSECNFGLAEREVVAIGIRQVNDAEVALFAALPSGLFYSTTLGRLWTQRLTVPYDVALLGVVCVDNVLVVASDNDGVVYMDASARSPFRRPTFSGGEIRALAASPSQTLLALATPSVVALSRDAGEYWTRTRGKAPPGILTLAVRDDGAIACGTQRHGLWLYL